MKRYVSAVCLGMLISASASAKIVIFDFTGILNSTAEINTVTNVTKEVASSSLNGTAIGPGSVFHGYFSFDTKTPAVSYTENSPTSAYATYEYPAGDLAGSLKNSMSITFGQSGRTVTSGNSPFSATSIRVGNSGPDEGYDYLDFVPTSASVANGYENMSLNIINSSGTMLGSAGLPTTIDFDNVDNARFYYDFSSGTGPKALTVTGFLTSLTARQTSPVPEPSSDAMLAVGLLTVAAATRRRYRRTGAAPGR